MSYKNFNYIHNSSGYSCIYLVLQRMTLTTIRTLLFYVATYLRIDTKNILIVCIRLLVLQVL